MRRFSFFLLFLSGIFRVFSHTDISPNPSFRDFYLKYNAATSSNSSSSSLSSSSSGGKSSGKSSRIFQCLPKNSSDPAEVHLVDSSFFSGHAYHSNGSHLLLSRSTPAPCMLAFFYSQRCSFSVDAAPHFNALAKFFPDLDLYAIDSASSLSSSSSANILYQFGVLALPSILLFHNHRAVHKYNLTQYDLPSLAEFVTRSTGLKPISELRLTDEDYKGPIPTVLKVETDWYLYSAWAFTIFVGLSVFGRSSQFEKIVEYLRNVWREVEIQHEHAD